MKKIEIAFELVNTMSLTRQYKGQQPYEMHEVNEIAQKAAARNSKEHLLDMLDTELNRQKVAREEYYEKAYMISDEGKALEEQCRNDYEAYRNDIIEEIMHTIHSLVGDNWQMVTFGDRGFTVGMKNPDDAKHYIFGTGIEFYCGYEFGSADKYRFQMNLSTSGAFEILGEDTIKERYIAIGKLLAATDKMNELRDELKQFTDNVKELQKKLRDARKAFVQRMIA